ncbi:MAG: hypothetical protein WBA10_11870 [Elainellaceae cyanobacterium]
MANSIISVKDTSLVQIKLLEALGSAYVTVNERHFALRAGETINISQSLSEGTNVATLAVTAETFEDSPLKVASSTLRDPLGSFSKKHEWMGRFEIYIDGDVAGSYIKQGGAAREKDHTVASIGVNVVRDASTPTVMQLINRFQMVEGMMDADKDNSGKSHPHILFKNGMAIRTWKKPTSKSTMSCGVR